MASSHHTLYTHAQRRNAIISNYTGIQGKASRPNKTGTNRSQNGFSSARGVSGRIWSTWCCSCLRSKLSTFPRRTQAGIFWDFSSFPGSEQITQTASSGPLIFKILICQEMFHGVAFAFESTLTKSVTLYIGIYPTIG